MSTIMKTVTAVCSHVPLVRGERSFHVRTVLKIKASCLSSPPLAKQPHTKLASLTKWNRSLFVDFSMCASYLWENLKENRKPPFSESTISSQQISAVWPNCIHKERSFRTVLLQPPKQPVWWKMKSCFSQSVLQHKFKGKSFVLGLWYILLHVQKCTWQ